MLTNLLHRLVAQPRIYDLLQRLLGVEQSLQRLRRLVTDVGPALVLDVGAGTGNGLRVLPSQARYLWLDNDSQKLSGMQRMARPFLAILGSATAIPLNRSSVDVVLCMAMSHHLDDQEVLELFSELARVCRNRLVFVDPVEHTQSFVSRLLWKYDRGSYPRSVSTLRGLIQQRFEIEHDEEYSIYHRYWLCSARAKKPPSGEEPA